MLLFREIGTGKAILILLGLNKNTFQNLLPQFKNTENIRNFCVISHGLNHL